MQCYLETMYFKFVSLFLCESQNCNIDQNSTFSRSISCRKRSSQNWSFEPETKTFWGEELSSGPQRLNCWFELKDCFMFNQNLKHWFKSVLWPIWINSFVRWSREELLCLNLTLWYWDSVNKPYRSIARKVFTVSLDLELLTSFLLDNKILYWFVSSKKMRLTFDLKNINSFHNKNCKFYFHLQIIWLSFSFERELKWTLSSFCNISYSSINIISIKLNF